MTSLRDDDFRRWLLPQRRESGHYRHARLDEDAAARANGLEALRRAAVAAHDDARRWIEEMLGESLDPFDETDLPAQYPHGLHTLTLQGYLGEILAGVIAENFDPHDVRWEVPGFLFRFHAVALEGLDRRLLLGDEPTRTPGRTGDDCIAFLRGPDGRIEAWLNCEAKCSAEHSAGLISGGHSQLSRPLRRAASALQLISVLQASTDPAAEEWIAALRIFRTAAATPDAATRADLFVYVCGQRPVREPTWLPLDRPHWRYLATHPLEAVEVHLNDVDAVLSTTYPGHDVDRD